MLEPITFEEGILILVIVQLLIGISQFLYYPSIRRYVNKQIFPDKSYFVSVIVPVKGSTPTLTDNFRSLCTQEYPNYEVIFVSESEDDPGAAVAHKIIDEWRQSNDVMKAGGKGGEAVAASEDPDGPSENKGCFSPSNVRYVCAGELTDLSMIAKSHNMIKALEIAEAEVYLFTDSDVFHPSHWIREMINPLGEEIRGKTISASTAVFFIDPEGFLGIFPSLSTNVAAFLSSFTRKYQDLPTYASGASMAVFSSVFYQSKIIDAWKKSLNDDLVLATTIVDAGFSIFNVRRLPTRPVEKFTTWKGMNNKMVRWMLTVNHYTHPSYHREAYSYGVINLQFQTLLNISLILSVLQLLGLADLDWSLIFRLLLITYGYNVATRFIIARIIKEKNVYPYLWLSPISQYFWGIYFVYLALFCRKFTWGGREYHLNKRFGKLIKSQ